MRTLPRHLFVDEALASRAYENTALPIGQGQTISQPYVVARMTEALLAEGAPSKILEIGTGCGYQTAILGKLTRHVFSVERIPSLLAAARERLDRLRIFNVTYRLGDGYEGFSVNAPYDAILVTAASATIPPALIDQLVPGGQLVMPQGGGSVQELLLITKKGTTLTQQVLDRVSFVPMIADPV